MMKSSKLIPALLILWLLLILSGFWMLWQYANTPGSQGHPNAGWMIPASLNTDTQKPTLVLFAHPRCPCTRATMSELERLQGDYGDVFSTLVLFYEPIDGGDSWRSTDLWRRALTMKHTTAVADPGGELAMRAGAETSGQIMLKNVDGGLEFWGGITASRGHESESFGGIALRSLIQGLETGHRRTQVFGCSLIAENGELDCLAGEACCELSGQ